MIVRRARSLLIEQRQTETKSGSATVQSDQVGKTKNVLVVLQFLDNRQCNLFCDRLMELNNSKVADGSESGHEKKLESNADSRKSRNKRSVIAPLQNDTITYIIRLLHDDSFQHFVESIENELTAIPECADILESIGGRMNLRKT